MMPINTIFATAAAAILLFGPVGGQMLRQTAQSPVAASHPAISQQAPAQTSADCANQTDDSDVEDAVADSAIVDTDTEELQCGDQNAPDGAEADTESEDAASDQSDAAPHVTPAITADQARATAEAHLNAGTASKVELDDENGQWVYSVEIGSVDVKVDALTGAIVAVDNDKDAVEGAANDDQDTLEEGDQTIPDPAIEVAS